MTPPTTDSARPLSAAELRVVCDPADLPFETTDELEVLDEAFGQDRAVEAIRLALGVRHHGYNVYVQGRTGSGRRSLLRRVLTEVAPTLPVPDDQVYVHDFVDPQSPRAIQMPAGRGAVLRTDMERLIDDVREALRAAFQSDAYQAERKGIDDEFQGRHEAAFASIRTQAAAQGVALVTTPRGFALLPERDGAVLRPEQLGELTDEEQAAHEATIEALQSVLEEALRQAPRWKQERLERIRALDEGVTREAASQLIDELANRWFDVEEVEEWLEGVRDDIVANAHRFVGEGAGETSAQASLMSAALGRDGPADRLQRYRVNVLVDHTGQVGAPVVWEDDPTLPALLGRVEHKARLGALHTSFMLIRPGALHRANGGFLVLDVLKLLKRPMAWEHLEQALRAGHIRIRSLGEAASLVSTQALEPEPIPLDVKVMLVGDRRMYHLLSTVDPEFPALFKVTADFEDEIDRTDAGLLRFARLLTTLARQSELRPFGCDAVAWVIAHASRLAGDSEKLTAHVAALGDLLVEADHFAGQAGHAHVTADDVRAALAAQRRRHGRLRDRMLEHLTRGTLNVVTEGTHTGQINALVVVSHGPVHFGHPARVTARARLGGGKVVDIEREVQLGGPVHSKGVLILQGFLGARYAQDAPFALQASLGFEQSYGQVDGDSASVAETCALLSALADVPVRQDLAITGSMDQHGQVQAIGGVNEKVEGFFDVCAARGLTGTQGVLIPADNVVNLMLRGDVLDAIEAGTFHVWSVATVDQAMTLLSGLPTGARAADGSWLTGGLDEKVERRLRDLAEKSRAFLTSGTERR